MTSLHPDTFTPNLRQALNAVKSAGSSMSAAEAKSLIRLLDNAFNDDAKQFGAGFVKGCSAYAEYQTASANLQAIAAAAVNRVGDGGR